MTDNSGAANKTKVSEPQTVNVLPVPPPPANKLPIAQFSISTTEPLVGQQVTMKSFSVDPDGSIVSQRWDLDGDGDYGENVSGATAFTTFASAGPRIVRLEVRDDDGDVQIQSSAITVQPAPVTTPAPKAKLSLLSPLAVVRLAGSATMRATRVDLLQVRAPAQSLVEVRCAGKSCPAKSVKTRAKRKPVRFKAMERSLRAGTVLTVSIRKSGYIGKYTRFLMRAGKAPKRTDACLVPGRKKSSRCPSA